MSNKKASEVLFGFLDNYINFGSMNRLASFSANHQAYKTIADTKLRSIYIAKMFEQFVANLEDLFGACIAIRHREDDMGFIYSFLTYDSSFKNSPSTRSADLATEIESGIELPDLLRLPCLDQLKQKLNTEELEVFAEIVEYHQEHLTRREVHIKSDLSFVEYLYKDVHGVLENAVKNISTEGRLLWKSYSKLKHGFMVVDDIDFFGAKNDLESGKGCWVVVPNSKYTKDGDESPVELVSATEKDLALYENQVRSYAGAVKSLLYFVSGIANGRHRGPIKNRNHRN